MGLMAEQLVTGIAAPCTGEGVERWKLGQGRQGSQLLQEKLSKDSGA